ncbi:hypothetical protein JHK82_055819 [Glycine max]|nr:hypothetical protein JHK85_056647 [Glycine max]KAG5074453.1 hypothetical protein JHK84_055684 [Glycine max]KAG5077124.1 hypothetical protein JHK82_055819 [Glycine max]
MDWASVFFLKTSHISTNKVFFRRAKFKEVASNSSLKYAKRHHPFRSLAVEDDLKCPLLCLMVYRPLQASAQFDLSVLPFCTSSPMIVFLCPWVKIFWFGGLGQLDIQFSNLDELQVNYNNDHSRTSQPQISPQSRKADLHKCVHTLFLSSSVKQPGYSDVGKMYAAQDSGAKMTNVVAIATAFGGGLPPGISGTNDRCIVDVSNLNLDKIDEDKLFNLFSIYRNIMSIKLLQDKPNHALIQMRDDFQEELVVHFL